MKFKKILFIGVGLLLVTGVAVTIFAPKTKPVTTTTPSTTTIVTPTDRPSDSAIISQLTPEQTIANLNTGNTTVLSVEEPANNWYIATLRINGNADDAKAVYQADLNNNLSLVAGPSTSFDGTELNNSGVPLAVQDKLVVFNE